MRIATVERPRSLKNRALVFIIGKSQGGYVPDVVKTLMHRPALFGKAMSTAFQEVMRGPSEWSVGERELFAAFVSRQNQCVF
jgi:hypothetical protein